MTKKANLSPEARALLGLAGAFNTEEARWSLRKHEGFWQVTRDNDGTDPTDIEVKAQFKTNGEAHESMSIMSDIAAAKAFLAELSKMLEGE